MTTSTSWLASLRARLGLGRRSPRPAPCRYQPKLQVLEDRLSPSVSNGLIAFSTLRDEITAIYTMNPDGTGQASLSNNQAFDGQPAWSPDGSKIAFASRLVDGTAFGVFVMNADGTGRVNLTNTPGTAPQPSWSPDGSKIAFSSVHDGNTDIYVMNADGTGQTRLTNNAGHDIEPTWSPDGSKIAFFSTRDPNNTEIYVMNADGSGETNLTNSPADDGNPAWSPDGTKIAFVSFRDGNAEIYVMNADGTGQTNHSNNAAADLEPAWSPDGTKIAFRSQRDGNGEIYVMNADGTGQTRLTNHAALDGQPAWQPVVNNHAPTEIALSNSSVQENQPVGTTVGNFSTSDPDAGDTHTYALVSGTGSGDNASFTISGNQLKTAASFDFEAKSSYSIRVKSTDAAGLSVEKVFTISATNVNEAPTLSVPGSQIAFEDVDKAITSITVGDPDGDNLIVTLNVGHGSLTLGSTSGLSVNGNGTGAVSLSGSIANLNAALASLLYRGSLNFSGADSLSVSVSDGSLNTSGGVAITVKSAAQQAVDFQVYVDSLVTSGVLTSGQGEALNVNLKDNNGDAGKVQAFLNQVQAFLNGGILTQAQADTLLGRGSILLLSVTRR